jgi:hypothetical protein
LALAFEMRAKEQVPTWEMDGTWMKTDGTMMEI